MENQNTNQPVQNSNAPQPLPNSTAVLVLGILSIAVCGCFGLPSIIMGIIGLSMSTKAKALYLENPGLYTEGSFKNMNAGRICSIIGLCLSGLSILYWIVYLFIMGAALSTLPWMMNQ